jgi:hypothetical protein
MRARGNRFNKKLLLMDRARQSPEVLAGQGLDLPILLINLKLVVEQGCIQGLEDLFYG